MSDQPERKAYRQTEEELKEAREHRDVLLALQAVFATVTGRTLFKYFFKHFEVGGLPPIGMDGPLLMDKLGSLRAGQAIFQLAAEADPRIASEILAELKKEEYDEIYKAQITDSRQ